MPKPKISICITTFNRVNNLTNSLKSTAIVVKDYAGL